MRYTIAVVLLMLWLLGLVTSHTIGGFIHVLLVIAVVVILLRIISGRSPLCICRGPRASVGSNCAIAPTPQRAEAE